MLGLKTISSTGKEIRRDAHVIESHIRGFKLAMFPTSDDRVLTPAELWWERNPSQCPDHYFLFRGGKSLNDFCTSFLISSSSFFRAFCGSCHFLTAWACQTTTFDLESTAENTN